MTLTRTEYLDSVNAPGAYVAVSWDSNESKYATAANRRDGVELVKYVRAVVRTGVNYANLAVNAERETGSLPWGEWVTFPYIITHRDRDYARLYILDGSVRTIYTVNGVPVSRSEYVTYLIPSKRESKRSTGGTITVRFDNLASVGRRREYAAAA